MNSEVSGLVGSPQAATPTQVALFGEEPQRREEQALSADRRRTLRQRELIEAGVHPLTRRKVNADPDRRCGNCWYRGLVDWHNRTYPKCLNDRNGKPTHGAATDVRASWPACDLHSYGEPRLSPDAARYVP